MAMYGCNGGEGSSIDADVLFKNIISWQGNNENYYIEDIRTNGITLFSVSDFSTVVYDPFGLLVYGNCAGAGDNGATVTIKFHNCLKFGKCKFYSWGRDKTVAISGSNDGTNFTEFYRGSHGGVDALDITINPTIAYYYYRITLAEKNDNNGIFITSLRFSIS